MVRKKKTDQFEESLEKLGKIVEQLEQGEVPLEEALESFTEGVKLVQFCHKKLEEAERKIELLTKGQGGDWTTEAFPEGANNEA